MNLAIAFAVCKQTQICQFYHSKWNYPRKAVCENSIPIISDEKKDDDVFQMAAMCTPHGSAYRIHFSKRDFHLHAFNMLFPVHDRVIVNHLNHTQVKELETSDPKLSKVNGSLSTDSPDCAKPIVPVPLIVHKMILSYTTSYAVTNGGWVEATLKVRPLVSLQLCA